MGSRENGDEFKIVVSDAAQPKPTVRRKLRKREKEKNSENDETYPAKVLSTDLPRQSTDFSHRDQSVRWVGSKVNLIVRLKAHRTNCFRIVGAYLVRQRQRRM